jgi:hypothetical protein
MDLALTSTGGAKFVLNIAVSGFESFQGRSMSCFLRFDQEVLRIREVVHHLRRPGAIGGSDIDHSFKAHIVTPGQHGVQIHWTCGGGYETPPLDVFADQFPEWPRDKLH